MRPPARPQASTGAMTARTDTTDSTDAVRATYREFADNFTEHSPSYRAWAHAIADDATLAARIATLPPREQQPNLVFAAARWLGADTATPQALREALTDSWDEVAAVTASRATQTNEVGRCGVLLPLLAALPQPLALLEVGASAGLCLLPDRYSYRWRTGEGELGQEPGREHRLDPADGPSPVLIDTAVSVRDDAATALPATLPATMPEVIWRAGYDLAPIDVRDDDATAWLQNLVWPGEDDRAARLRAAVDVARLDPPRIVRGDLTGDLADLRDLAAEAPPEATLVVMHSAVLVYLAEADRRRVQRALLDLPGRWIANEGHGVVDVAVPDGWADDERHPCTVTLDGVAVGRAHGHGRSVVWVSA